MSVRDSDFPFKVGQQIESRSFKTGYRGAWFKSKIKSISRRKSGLGYELEFPDFPGEKPTWTKIYEKPPTCNNRRSNPEEVLMVRPLFPPVYQESQMPDVNTISEEAVVLVNDIWKVGDLIDWWEDGCYWSGSITKLLKEDKVKIALLPLPIGEGLSYVASRENLRPSLDWSPEHGWTVPTPTGSAHGHCARIMKLSKKGKNQNLVARTTGDKRGGVRIAERLQSSLTSHGNKLKGMEGRALGLEARKKMRTPEPNVLLDTENVCSGKASCSNTKSDSFILGKSTEVGDVAVATSVRKERLSHSEEVKKARGVVGAPELPLTTHTSSGSLSKSCNGRKDMVKQPLGGTAGTKRLSSETDVDSRMANGGTKKMSGSDSDSSSHFKARSSGTGDKTGGDKTSGAKDTLGCLLGDDEERDVRVVDKSLESPVHVTPNFQPPDRFGAVEKQCLGTVAEEEAQSPGMAVDLGVENSSIRTAGCSGSGRRENKESGVGKETVDHGGPSKKMRVYGRTPGNPMLSDTIEGSVVDLEELLYLIKWMKGILNNGTTTWPAWKFLGHRSSSTPK